MVSSFNPEISRHKLVELRKEVEIQYCLASLVTSSKDPSRMINTRSTVTLANLHSEMAKNLLELRTTRVKHSDLQDLLTPDFIELSINICKTLTTSRKDSEMKMVVLQSDLEISSQCPVKKEML